MNLVELFLRLGCSLVAWMVVLTHLVWLATLRVVDCGASDEFYRLMLGFAPITILFAFFLGLSKNLKSVHPMLRWGALPTLILLPLALMPVINALMTVTLGEGSICSPEVAMSAWHAWWAPIQLVTLTIVAWRAWVAFKA